MSLLESISALSNTVKTVHDAKIKIELQSLIIEVQNQVLALQDQLREKQSQIEKLEREKRDATRVEEFRTEFDFRCNSYWRKSDPADGPYCVNCLESSGKMSRVLRLAESSEQGHCAVCDKRFNKVFDVAARPQTARKKSRHDQFMQL